MQNQIPLPETSIHTKHGWRIWWRFFRNLATTTNVIIDSGGDAAAAQLGEFEAAIAGLQNRVDALEKRYQPVVPPQDQIGKTQVQAMIEGLRQAIEAVERLVAPTANPGVFGNMTITEPAGLHFTGQTSDAGAATATMTNAPHAANPVFWLPAVINGTAVAIPAWAL